jgi:hypothetical protein
LNRRQVPVDKISGVIIGQSLQVDHKTCYWLRNWEKLASRNAVDVREPGKTLNRDCALSTLIGTNYGRLELTVGLRLDFAQRPAPLSTGCTQTLS